MSYGLIVRGSHGQEQIDGSYKNFNLVSKVTLTLSARNEFSVPGWFSETTVNTPYPVVFVRAADYVQTVALRVSGNTWRVIAHSRVQNLTVTLYIFGDSNTPWGGGDYGLQVRNDSGAVVFDSRWAPLRIVAHTVLSGGAPGPGASAGAQVGPASSVIGPAGRTLAVKSGAMRSYIRVTGSHPGTEEWWDDFVFVSGNVGYIRKQLTDLYERVPEDPNWGSHWHIQGPSPLMLADVTNY